MRILQRFQAALQNALDTYQTEKKAEGKTLSENRINDVNALKAILATNSRNAGLLRQAVVKCVSELKAHPLASVWPSVFDSELRRKINGVLNQPDYSEFSLTSQTLAEQAERQEKIEGYLRSGEVTELVNKIENLEDDLKKSEQKCTQLEAENQQLTLENAQLKRQLAAYSKSPPQRKTAASSIPEAFSEKSEEELSSTTIPQNTMT